MEIIWLELIGMDRSFSSMVDKSINFDLEFNQIWMGATSTRHQPDINSQYKLVRTETERIAETDALLFRGDVRRVRRPVDEPRSVDDDFNESETGRYGYLRPGADVLGARARRSRRPHLLSEDPRHSDVPQQQQQQHK